MDEERPPVYSPDYHPEIHDLQERLAWSKTPEAIEQWKAELAKRKAIRTARRG